MANQRLTAALVAAGGLARIDHLAGITGCSTRAVRAVAQRSLWWCPYPSVVGLPGSEVAGSEAWARAATLHARGRTGDRARDVVALTRRSALHHLGVARSAPTRVEVVMHTSRFVAPQPRLSVLRSSHLCAADIMRVRGVPVVRGAALVRDLAAVRDVGRLRSDAIWLQHAGYLDLGELRRMYTRCERFAGRGAVARVLSDLEAAGRVDSPLEHEFRAAFAGAGILLDRGQVEVPVPAPVVAVGERPRGGGSLHLDLGIAVIRFGIEVDSMAHHSSPEDLRRDAERRNRIAQVAEDWRILHLSYADLDRSRWAGVVAQARAVIEAQSRRHLGVAWPRVADLR